MILVGILFAVVTTVFLLFYETVHAEVTEVRIASERIRGELKIVHISDLHGRTRFWTGTVGEIVDSLKPDIVCVTGDLFNRLGELPEVMQELSRLECEYLYFVPGNHEWEERKAFISRRFSDEEHERVLRDIGIRKMRVLVNEGELIEVKQSNVYVYGYDNSKKGREMHRPPQEDISGAFRLTLAHSPSIAGWMEREALDSDLLLAGHTHGGQIRPFGRALGRFGRYPAGLNNLGPGRFMYVTRGLGTVRLPFRFRCRPEVVLIRVVGER